MPRNITIITPENVRIEYELAGIASRAGAVVIDTLIQMLSILAVFLVFFSMGVIGGSAGTQWALTVIILWGFLVFWGYFMFFETVWNGQTPGKRLSRLRTVREGGIPIDLSCAALRNLIRLVDFLPVLPTPYIVGGICVLATKNNKRLGDLAAGTLVVKERAEWAGDLLAPAVPIPQGSPMEGRPRFPEAARVRNIELVTPEEFEAAKRFVERRIELQPMVGEQVAVRIAQPLMARLGIEDIPPMTYGNLISEIYYMCVEERGMR